MTFEEAGRKGGTALFEKIGRDGMSERGKLGGRPRSLTYIELKERGLLRNIELKEVVPQRRDTGIDKSLELVLSMFSSKTSQEVQSKQNEANSRQTMDN